MSDTSSQPGSSRFKRSISTDSFLREVTDAGLPRHYYGRTNRTPLNLAVSVGGVLGSLCIYGVLQERLMTIPYGGTTEEPESAEMFTSSVFLVLMNRLVTVCVSAMGIVLTGDSFRTMTPLNLYASIAFANLVTTVCQYEVLKYLSFAASTLAKCAKIIPVMIWGRVILHKSYGWRDYAMAALVTAGCFLFVLDRGVIQNRQLRHGGETTLNDVDSNGAPGTEAPPAPFYYDPVDISDPVVSYTSYFDAREDGEETRTEKTETENGNETAEEEETGAQVLNDIITGGGGHFMDSVMNRGQAHMYLLGTLIMCVYLGFDGFTSTFQQKLYRHYTCSILNQIFFTTCFSALFSLIWLLSTNQMTQVVFFLGRHPGAIQDVFVLSVSAAVSQFAISYTIFCFGAVTLASVMTFRQFLSVVISCFLFGSPLSVMQWTGLMMVLAPVADRVVQERSRPEIFGKSPGGVKTRGGGGGLRGRGRESPRGGRIRAGSRAHSGELLLRARHGAHASVVHQLFAAVVGQFLAAVVDFGGAVRARALRRALGRAEPAGAEMTERQRDEVRSRRSDSGGRLKERTARRISCDARIESKIPRRTVGRATAP